MFAPSKIRVLVTAVLLSMPFVSVVQAQPVQPGVERTDFSYSDAELKSFAAAFLEVQRLINAYQPTLDAAAGPAEQDRVIEKATNEALPAIIRTGLNVDKFNEILVMGQINPGIATRIRQQHGNIGI